ncbi:MAG: BMP family ABC transporter substrate-binding protein, partial [Oscillospiraceae bacterium]|nr:BMP family ABC transporter substrate-binding protein [Oscillospiraceae bacterium]
MKKLLALILALVMSLSLAACGGSNNNVAEPAADNTSANDETEAPAAEEETETPDETAPAAASDVKVGFIYLHDEQSTYDLNFMNAAKEACDKLGIEYVQKVGVPEGQECYEAAMDLVDEGCNIVFADSFGHEDYLIQAAKECPDVQFCHATGTKAHTEGLANYHNAFASIYEGRYLAGIAAGLKVKEMIDNGEITADQAKLGYVGAFTYAEVISGYTAFFLGVRSV